MIQLLAKLKHTVTIRTIESGADCSAAFAFIITC